MPSKKIMRNPEFATKTGQFLNIAYKDYLASRVLINSGLLLQGAVLASTAIEKYFKAILAFRGNESPGHLSAKHFNAAKNFHAHLAAALNDDFVKLLQRAYEMRYLDTLDVDFNLVIASREFLAELDYSAVMIQESFVLEMQGAAMPLQFDLDKANGDPRLLLDNHTLTLEAIEMVRPLSALKQEFISAEPQQVYEVRNCKLRGLVETTYYCTARVSDRKFLREGFMPVDPARQNYALSLPPIFMPP